MHEMLQFLLQKVIPNEVIEGLGPPYPSNDFFMTPIGSMWFSKPINNPSL
jgi:hypothetical protein